MQISFEEIPPYMWMSRVSYNPPTDKNLRRKIALELFGWNHKDLCHNKKFHVPYLHQSSAAGYDHCHDNQKKREYCTCVVCGDKMTWNHKIFCNFNKDFEVDFDLNLIVNDLTATISCEI